MFAFLDRISRFIKGQRGKWALVLSLFLGAVSALSLPPYPFTPLYFLGLGLALILLGSAKGLKGAFLLGLAFGFGYFGLGVSWVGQSFLAQTDVPQWSAPLAVFLLVLYLSLFPALAFLISKRLWSSNWAGKALIFAGIYGLFEWLRSITILGFPWNTTSSIWSPVDEMIQTVALVGSMGLGLITLLCVGLFATLFDSEAPRRLRIALPIAGAAILAGLATFGWVRLDGAGADTHDGITLRLVQANISQIEKWPDHLLLRNLDQHISLSTSSASSEAGITHIIWPETAIPDDFDNPVLHKYLPDLREYLIDKLGPGATLISGAIRRGEGDNPRVFNSIISLSPEGEILAVYDKAHLVPFGEYVPFRALLEQFGLDTIVAERGDISTGPGLKTVQLPALPPFSPLICYEIIFSGNVVAPGTKPGWLLNVTNDAWFGTSAGPYQHFEMARLRAVEQGVAVVRVAGTGISGVIDPYGRVTAKLDLGVSGVLDAGLPVALPEGTMFASNGHLPFFILLAVFIVMGLLIKPSQEPKMSSF